MRISPQTHTHTHINKGLKISQTNIQNIQIHNTIIKIQWWWWWWWWVDIIKYGFLSQHTKPKKNEPNNDDD